MPKKKNIEEMYQKKTQLEHILLRPDTYIGSIEQSSGPMWVWDEECKGIVKKDINYVPGLYKIFDEILVNSVDNFHRNPATMNALKVTIDRDQNMISVWNNGDTIPIEVHPKEKVYCAELIFGHLLTSSNYDDAEEKVTGGRNGYGAKLTNIYSKKFVIETAEAASGKKYKQVFTDNMGSKTEPSITDYNGKENYTKISFIPDFERFSMTGLDDDTVSLLTKRVYDVAGITPKALKIYLNNSKLEVNEFNKYVELYFKNQEMVEEDLKTIYEKPNERWEVITCLSDGDFKQVSFVNSICTTLGGTHVNYLADQMTSHIQGVLKKKHKKEVKANQVKSK